MLNINNSTELSARVVRVASHMRVAILAAAVTLGAIATGTQSASASPITLGSASSYGVFVGSGNTLALGGGFNLSGNLGLGSSDTLSKSGSNAVSGTEYRDSSLTTSGSGTLTVSGGTITQSMSAIRTAAESASTTAAALTATTGLTDQGGSITSSVTIKALTNLSENVLDISALSLANSTLTFDDNGFTGAKFIVNVTGAFSVTGSSIIKGINGASGSDVIFNIEGTGSTVSLTGNSSSSLIGTILAPTRNINLSGGGTLTGAVLAGLNGTGYTVQTQTGGYNITSLGYVPRSVSTPEPSSIALFGAGVGVLIAIRRRMRPARP